MGGRVARLHGREQGVCILTVGVDGDSSPAELVAVHLPDSRLLDCSSQALLGVEHRFALCPVTETLIAKSAVRDDAVFHLLIFCCSV